MGINTKKVLVGGLAAGVVIFVIDFVANGLLLSGSWEQEMNALNPQIVANTQSPAAMASFAAIDLAFGIIVVWLYAAIRPRFGAGPRTAVIAGLFAWVYASVMWAGFAVLGFYSWRMFGVGAIAGLAMFIPGALAGGALYKEESRAAAGPGVPGGTLGAPDRGVRV